VTSPLRARKRGALRVLWAALRGARKHTPMRQLSSYAKPWSVLRFQMRFGLLCELIRELRNVYYRIAEMHSKAEDEQGAKQTWLRVFPKGQHHAAYQARNLDIQNLRNRYPWLSAFDVELHREGFVGGWLWQSGKTRMEEQQIDLTSPYTVGEMYPNGVPKSSI
jgi:hypothetical protein